MSYNIDTWKTKRLDNLVIPLEAFYKHARADWHPRQPVIIDALRNEVSLACGCEQAIWGVLHDGQLTITKFEMAGEGSGTFYNWILEPALRESKGTLEAVLIWEGGDAVQRLSVCDGIVDDDDVDL
jgi:hypothetical protein